MGRSKYRKGGQYIVTIFWPRGQNIVGVKISSHTGIMIMAMQSPWITPLGLLLIIDGVWCALPNCRSAPEYQRLNDQIYPTTTRGAHVWSQCDIPNPLQDWRGCGRGNGTGWLCDPDGVLDEQQCKMMTSWRFLFYWPLWGESTGNRWMWIFYYSLSLAWTTCWINSRVAVISRRLGAHVTSLFCDGLAHSKLGGSGQKTSNSRA